jgi:hypothetical protein
MTQITIIDLSDLSCVITRKKARKHRAKPMRTQSFSPSDSNLLRSRYTSTEQIPKRVIKIPPLAQHSNNRSKI